MADSISPKPATTGQKPVDSIAASRHVGWLFFFAFVLAVFVLPQFFSVYPSSLVDYPIEWRIPLDAWAKSGMVWLVEDFDLGLFTFKEFTRALSWLLTRPFILAEGLLIEGFFSKPGQPPVVPPLSWVGILFVCVMISLRVGSLRLATGVGTCVLYMAVFGLWESAMATLASMSVAVPLGVVGGLSIGILVYRNHVFAAIAQPILDVMQTMPIFAYLVPVLFLFGFGPVAALTATIVYALPPMVRVTKLALEQVPKEVIEAGEMAGCSNRQLLMKVLLPSAAPSLAVGINQVIMLSLTVVIIASMIGAGGLGYDVLVALRRLSIGRGLETGLAITLMAIAMDQLSQAAIRRNKIKHHGAARLSVWLSYRAMLVVLVISTAAGYWIDFLAMYPESLTISTAPFWDGMVSWININLYDTLKTIKYAFILGVMVPLKNLLHGLPWSGVVALIGFVGFVLGGWRLGILTGLLVLFIAVTGNWEKATTTAYLVTIGVALSFLIGFPVGILSAHYPGFRRIVLPVIDTLQTLPAFVYLIPAVMLFQNGDFAALIAIVAYSVVPSIRYTDHGIRMIKQDLVEASEMIGCTRLQVLVKVKLPLALPEIMLGINQTIMMALSMLIITALVGTVDLGQEVLNALQKADAGRGLVAGLCVAFIAIVADRLITAGVARVEDRSSGKVPANGSRTTEPSTGN